MDSIYCPLDVDGWGMRDMKWFNLALLTCNLERVFNEPCSWSEVIHSKYVQQKCLEEWVAVGAPYKWRKSYIWRNLMFARLWFCGNLRWHVGNDDNILIGLDVIKDMHVDHTLSPQIMFSLHHMGIQYLVDLKHWFPNLLPSSAQHHSLELGLKVDFEVEWESYRLKLIEAWIVLYKRFDSLAWGGFVDGGNLVASDVYIYISGSPCSCPNDEWIVSMWRWEPPLKIKCFSWLTLFNRILIWENLMKRGYNGLSRCQFFRSNLRISHICFWISLMPSIFRTKWQFCWTSKLTRCGLPSWNALCIGKWIKDPFVLYPYMLCGLYAVVETPLFFRTFPLITILPELKLSAISLKLVHGSPRLLDALLFLGIWVNIFLWASSMGHVQMVHVVAMLLSESFLIGSFIFFGMVVEVLIVGLRLWRCGVYSKMLIGFP